MAFRDLVAETSYEGSAILGDWDWLLQQHYELWLVTKFGDAFLKKRDEGSIHWLNTVQGSVEFVAADEEAFERECHVPENLNAWFMPEVVKGQELLGMTPRKDQCLSFVHPPVLGGQLDPDNIEVTDIAVHFSIMGQIHRQVKDLPEGTKIDSIRIEMPRSTSLLGRLKRMTFGS
jgi:hypothetical protein